MSTMPIRYKVDPSVRSYNLVTYDYSIAGKRPEDYINVKFDHQYDDGSGSGPRHVYFLDIVQFGRDSNRIVKVRIYMPDGSTVEGWQGIDSVMLHIDGNAFDGRFNTSKTQEA